MKWCGMKLISTCLFAIALTATIASPAAITAAGRADDDEKYPVKDSERIQRSLNFTGAGPHRLDIDNVTGSIQVAAHDGASVELTVTRSLAAATQERLEAARKEVTLDIKEEPSLISLYVDGPFRDCDCDRDGDGRRRRNGSRWRDRQYQVRYDFVLKVPRSIGLTLSNVNRGDIKIEGTTGDFEVTNVNGGIEMLDIAGSGRVGTINKDVRIVFRTNPVGPSSFKTLNGDVVVSFQPTLAADLRMKTFNGGMYTDFDTTALPALTPVSERKGNKFVYKADRSAGVRVGGGGPELRFETLNGDIRILQRRK
jgi:DUF4097 and DUF4098 domain-containing protein YvlB